MQDTLLVSFPSPTAYVFDDANRVQSVNGVIYTWDSNPKIAGAGSNLLFDGESYYQYDHASRLISFSNQSTVSSYQYNGLGDRISQTVNGQNTTYTLDLNTGLTQVLADGTYTYLYGNGRIAQSPISNPQSAIAYYLGDALGSVRQLTDSQASVTLSRSYAPYGEVTGSAGSGASAYGYTGEYTDPTGMVYLRARYYAPWQGRFVSRDTWAGDANIPMSYNMWLYGYANPVLYTDPTGRYSFEQLYGLSLTGDWGSGNQLSALRTAVTLVGNRFSDTLATTGTGYYHGPSWLIFRKVYGIRNDRRMILRWNPQVTDSQGNIIPGFEGCPGCRPKVCFENMAGEDGGSAKFWKDNVTIKIAVDPDIFCQEDCKPKGGITHGSRSIEFASLWQNNDSASVNNVIHELGHAFNWRVGGEIIEDAIGGYSTTINGQEWGLVTRPRGFYDTQYSNQKSVWMQSVELTEREIFADMFVGWVRYRWADDDYGEARANFMNKYMQNWIRAAMNKP